MSERIPAIPKHVSDAIEEWLTKYSPRGRSVAVAAPLLTLICILDEQQRFLPARRMAAHLKVSIGSIDDAIGTALAYGEIEEAGSDHPGATRRYLVPSALLMAAYTSAANAARRAV